MIHGIFVVIKKGVYRHDIAGVATNLEQAKEIAILALIDEPDIYHSFEIVQMVCNEYEPETIVLKAESNRSRTEFTFKEKNIVCLKEGPPQAETDIFNTIAYRILEKDPQVIDMIKDILKL